MTTSSRPGPPAPDAAVPGAAAPGAAAPDAAAPGAAVPDAATLAVLRSTLESSADAIVAVDQRGRMVYYNQRFLRMWNIPEEVLAAGDDATARALALAQVADSEAFLRQLREVWAHPEEESFELLRFKDGRIVEHYSLPQRLDGRPAGRVWSFRDVTERKRTEEELHRLQRERLRAESALQERLHFERLVSSVLARFINLTPGRLDEAIHDALRTIDDFSGADSSFVYLFGGAETAAFPIHSWYRGELALSRSAALALACRPGGWVAAQLDRPGHLHLVRLEDLPAAAAADRELLGEAGVRSLLLVPLLYGGASRGVLGLCARQAEKDWTDDTLALLEIGAEMFASALERRRAEEAVRASERRYRLLFERNLAGVFRNTANGRILDCNDAFAKIFGYSSRAECIGISAQSLYVDRRHRDSVVRRLREQGSLTNEEIAMRRIDGATVWVLANLNWLDGRDGEPELIEGTIVDITQRKTAESQIVYQAYHDALTDLPNRLLFHDRLTQALAQAHRHGHGLAVLFMDLDQFKLVNDTLGHGAGDRLLQVVAERLARAVRAEDTVARVGGDEFTLLLPRIAQADDAARVAQHVLAAVAEPAEIDDQRIFLTTSIGISVFPADGIDAEALLTSADIAMYRAKDMGRNGYQLCTPAMSAKALERLTLEQELREALERDELALFYQPQLDLASGRTRGFEALLRWRHALGGIILPERFIAVAEEARLIVPIGEWVLETACRQLRDWQARGLPARQVAVNLSPRQFQQQDLVPRVAAILERTGLPPGCLTLEITESAAMQNLERTVEVVAALRAMGIRIAIDDFGTGHAALIYLQQFAIDALKIDRAFVAGLATVGGSRAIVNSIIDLAHGLDLEVIAEGVETEDQRRFLASRGCDAFQGFLASPPVPADEAERFLAGSGTAC
jgi:diguanylate cyclase (GGDEF)-like protein/PAS domain S-box-containing protein